MEIILCNGRQQSRQGNRRVELAVFQEYKIPQLPLRQVVSNTFGELMFYEKKLPDYTIRYRLFNIKENVNVKITGNMRSPGLFFNMWGSINFARDGQPRRFMDSFDYYLDRTLGGTLEAWLEKDRQYGFLNISFPMSYFKPVVDPLRKWAILSACLYDSHSALPPKEFHHANIGMIQEAQKIIHCPHDCYAPKLYLESVVNALLLDTIDKSMRTQENTDHICNTDI